MSRLRRFFLPLLAMAVALLIAMPAGAQEQVGAITGTVTDASGGVLPGASVEAVSAGGVRLSTTTGSAGLYRLPRVPPGTYAVTAVLSGFSPEKFTNVAVALGQTRTINFSLELGAVTEEVTVQAPQIDVQGSTTVTSIADEQIERIPKGRDFTTVATQAAGAANEPFLGGISIDGASGSENRFVIDGIDTTHPQDGLSGQNIITDFLEEIQVKSAGYAAEYGGSVGGVINALTKSGENQFHGWVGAYYTDSSLNGDRRPIYYEDNPPSYHRTFEKDDSTRIEPGFGLGGPIFRDNAWFYVGYNPAFTTNKRTPEGSSTTFDQDLTEHFFTGNIKGNVGSQILYKLSANLSPRKTERSLPALDGSTPADADLTVDTDYPTTSYSGYVDFIPTRNFYLSGSAGYYEVDSETIGVDAISQIRFRNGVIPVPTTDPRYRPALFQTVPSASFQSITEDNWTREAAALASNLHVKAFGDHSFKAGVQYELIKNQVSRGENGNDYEIRWGLADRYGLGVIGTYGSVAVRHFRTEGGAESKNIGLFLQDSWAIRPNLTLNIGVRTEQERVPNYGAARDPTLPTNAIEFDFKDKLAPRLGFAWDVLSSQKLKVYGSYGIYYDITKIEMPRGSFGADQWITHVYPLNTLDWETLDDGCAIAQNNHTQNPCPALGAQRTRDLRLPTDPATAIDPDLQPMEQEEWQIGTEFQVTPNAVFGLRYVNKSLKNTIEDIGYLVFAADGSSGEEYITGNPGRGLVAGDPPGPSPAQAKAVRDYQAATLSFSRRFVDNWSLRANYTWSRLEGNYSGLASSDEFGRTDPNVARYFDGLAYGYDQNGRLVEGPLNTDHTHRVGAQFLYRMPWGTHVGLNSSWRSGSPVSSQASFNGVQFFPYGRGNQGNLDDLTQTDILVAHPFQIGPVSIELSVNVLNLFDEDAVTRVGNDKWQDDICDVRADCDTTNDWYFGTLIPYDYDTLMASNGATPNPAFNQALTYQAPRVVRLGLKLAF